MRLKSWFSFVLKAIGIRPNRAKRRWLKKKHALRISAAALAMAVSLPTLQDSATGQCTGPLFPPGLKFAAGLRPFSVTTGDFNGDGITDLATANFNSDDVSVLVGNGDGTFAAPLSFAREMARIR